MSCHDYDFFNVRDDLKGLELDEIKKIVQDSSFEANVCMVNISGDFNFGSLVRNANAFGFRRVHHVAPKKQWDRRGAVGSHHYIELEHWKTFDDLWTVYSGDYTWIALENNVDFAHKMYDLNDFQWPEKTMLVVGSEGEGLSEEILHYVDEIVTIPQYGSVRSINVSTASGIAMQSYSAQMEKAKCI